MTFILQSMYHTSTSFESSCTAGFSWCMFWSSISTNLFLPFPYLIFHALFFSIFISQFILLKFNFRFWAYPYCENLPQCRNIITYERLSRQHISVVGMVIYLGNFSDSLMSPQSIQFFLFKRATPDQKTGISRQSSLLSVGQVQKRSCVWIMIFTTTTAKLHQSPGNL